MIDKIRKLCTRYGDVKTIYDRAEAFWDCVIPYTREHSRLHISAVLFSRHRMASLPL
jgi:hypothetical protein